MRFAGDDQDTAASAHFYYCPSMSAQPFTVRTQMHKDTFYLSDFSTGELLFPVPNIQYAVYLIA